MQLFGIETVLAMLNGNDAFTSNRFSAGSS